MTQLSVEIETGDGICPAALSIPEGEGPWPGVIMFPDAGGMRSTMRQMGERLSGLGYVVLVPDFYYRNGPYEPVDMRTAFEDKESRDRIMGMMRSYTADLVVRDARLRRLPRLAARQEAGRRRYHGLLHGRSAVAHRGRSPGRRSRQPPPSTAGTSPKKTIPTAPTTRRAPSRPPSTWPGRSRTSRSPTSRRTVSRRP